MTEKYIPLYRKYRPQKFSDLVGQESVEKTISNAIELDRVAHAYLFTGPRGTGKTSSARIFAKSLNCVEGPTVNPCGKCPSCIDIANSNSVDVIEIDAASNRKVEDARNLLEKVQFVPVAGKYKVYIIDEVHMLTTEAFNTLLKTLEEPPKNLVFILATTEAHKVLNTIISRCQRFDFKRVGQDLIAARLKEIAEIENINIDDKALNVIARRSNGGLRDAVGLLDQSSVMSATKTITDTDILSLIGTMSEDNIFQITQSIAQRDTNSLISLIDSATLCTEPVQVIRELVNYFRNLLILKTSQDVDKIRQILDYSDEIIPKIKDQSESFEVNEIVQIIEKLSEYDRILKTTSNQNLWLEIGLISICHRQDILTIKELENRISNLEGTISGDKPVSITQARVEPVREIPKPAVEKPVVKPDPVVIEKTPGPTASVDNIKPLETAKESVKEPEKPAAVALAEAPSEEKAVSNTGNLIESWKNLLLNIDNVPSQSFFKDLAKPVEISPQRVVITFSNQMFVKKTKEDSNKVEAIKKASEKLFGNQPQVVIRTPLPEDASIQKAQVENKPVTSVNPVKIESEPKEAPAKAQSSQIVMDVENETQIEEEVYEQIDEINKKVVPVNIPEQAKMVLDLFNGKVIE